MIQPSVRIFLIALCVVVGGLFFRYGTLDPCDMLRDDFRRFSVEQYGSAGALTAEALWARNALDNDSYACARALVRFHTTDTDTLISRP
jgi:hypothetical protein